MTGLEKVTGRITSEAADDAAKLLAAAEEKCAQIAAEADRRIDAEKARLNALLEAEGKNVITRARSSASMQKRNIILSAKAAALDRAFAAAEEELCSMPKEKYVAFIVRCVSEAVDFTPDAERCGVRFNAKDAAEVGDDILKELSAAYPNIAFYAVDEPAAISGGALLDFGETDVDCSVASLIKRSREELEPKVCAVLFDSVI